MLLGFKRQFAPKILAGTKVLTVRSPRKVEPKIGETLHMYTGLRTKNCEKITDQHKLKSTQAVDIVITEYHNKGLDQLEIIVDGRHLDGAEQNHFVKIDGFNSITDFITYWKAECLWHREGKDFTVYMIDEKIMYHWTDLRF